MSVDVKLTELDFLELISRKLRIARASDRVTKTKLAKQCHISQSMISQIEAGTKMPSMKTLVKLAFALDTYPHWFLEPTQEIVNSFRKETK